VCEISLFYSITTIVSMDTIYIPCFLQHVSAHGHYLMYTTKHIDTRHSNISFTSTTYKTQHFSKKQSKKQFQQISILNSKILYLYSYITENTLYFLEPKQGENATTYLQANKTHTTYKIKTYLFPPTLKKDIIIINLFKFQTRKNPEGIHW
jgi:hypothetical protein